MVRSPSLRRACRLTVFCVETASLPRTPLSYKKQLRAPQGQGLCPVTWPGRSRVGSPRAGFGKEMACAAQVPWLWVAAGTDTGAPGGLPLKSPCYEIPVLMEPDGVGGRVSPQCCSIGGSSVSENTVPVLTNSGSCREPGQPDTHRKWAASGAREHEAWLHLQRQVTRSESRGDVVGSVAPHGHPCS